MPLTLQDTSPVVLDGLMLSGPTLELAHDGDALSSHGDELLDILDSLRAAEIVVPDFEANATTHQMHVWEIDDSTGALTKWSRGSVASVSGERERMNAEIVAVAVPPGVSVPAQPQPAGPPAPGTTQKKVRIKIGKQGDL